MKAALENLIAVTLFLGFIGTGLCIQCYQCDSNEDRSCPSDRHFDRNLNALIDCNSFEAKVPGTFCMKITQQSPGWGSWIKVTRRCGSRSDTGVAWGCRWNYEENGVWRETCYCEAQDGCNGASFLGKSLVLVLSCLLTAILCS